MTQEFLEIIEEDDYENKIRFDEEEEENIKFESGAFPFQDECEYSNQEDFFGYDSTRSYESS